VTQLSVVRFKARPDPSRARTWRDATQGVRDATRRRTHGPRTALPIAAPDKGSRHRNDIQGLRAIAVLLVALNHAGLSSVRGGYVGVDVFFVLSGFLITGLLLSGASKSKSRATSLTDFYSRRARRILPAAALTLVVTDVVAYRMLNFVRAKQVMHDSISASLFTANLHFASQGTNYFAQGQPPSPLQHFWSLAVEEQFYLVWPLLLFLVVFGVALRRRGRRASRGEVRISSNTIRPRRLLLAVAVIGVASLGWSIYDTGAHAASAYFSTFARAWELALGAALAIGATHLSRIQPLWRGVLGWLGLVAIGAAAVTFSSGTSFPGYSALLPTLGAAAVIAAGLGERHSRLAVGQGLSLAPFRFVGDRSYAFYLWHWPVLVVALDYTGHDLSTTTKLLLLCGAFGLSIVSYAAFENPIRRRRWSSARHALALWPAALLAVLLVAAWGTHSLDVQGTRLASAAAPQYPGLTADQSATDSAKKATAAGLNLVPATTGDGALPTVVASVKAAERGAPVPAALTPPVANLLADHYNYPPGCAAEDGQSSSNICSLGDARGSTSMVLLGDSHAQMWMPAILATAKHDDWVVHPVGKSACIPLEWWQVIRGTSDCRAWYPWALRQVRALHPDVVLLAAAWSGLEGDNSVATSGMRALIAQVRPFTKHVIVVADQPSQTKQPVDCLLAHDASMAMCSLTPTPNQLGVAQAIAGATRSSGAAYIDTRPWFCSDNSCPMVIGHTIAWMDAGGHITATYAAELAGVFRSALREALSHGRAT
jgi:peptidoglycan/LPS O-acetylase OafA/YrhL